MRFLRAIKRAWKWFICDHKNKCVNLGLADSTEVIICQGCGRVLSVMDDGDRLNNPHKRNRMAL